ncbi:MAG: RidA family protein [Allosphingosinicella sp.]|uniref:RidA family protein n=1 Tax=Allosphingosinicella sp. TaxID=2823234 RepID=UPI003932F134
MSGGGRDAAGGADGRFLALGDEIPPPTEVPPRLSFVTWRRSGPIVWLAGHGPGRRTPPPQFDYVGKVGADLTLEGGAAAARLVGLNLLVTLRGAIGSLDRVRQLLRLDPLVASAPGFHRPVDRRQRLQRPYGPHLRAGGRAGAARVRRRRAAVRNGRRGAH